MSASNPYSKAYNRTYWQNKPSTLTPINQNNLNNNEAGTDTLDDRIVALDTNKLDITTANPLFADISFDDQTGIFTFTRLDGTNKTIDTLLEKIAVNFDFDEQTETLIIYLEDGTTKTVDLSAFIAEWDFTDSSTIGWTVVNHVAVAVVKAHSIGSNELQTDYLADCVTARSGAELAEDGAEEYKLQAEAWAVGQRDGADVPSTNPTYHNNAKYYAGQADALGQAQAETAESWAVGKRGGTDVPSTDPAYHNNAKYYASSASTDATYAHDAIDTINRMLQVAEFTVNTTTGNLEYNSDTAFIFTVNEQTGNLEWEVSLV